MATDRSADPVAAPPTPTATGGGPDRAPGADPATRVWSRRQILGGGLAGAAALAGCGPARRLAGPTPPATGPRPATTAPRPDGSVPPPPGTAPAASAPTPPPASGVPGAVPEPAPPDPGAWRALADALTGDLVRPGAASYPADVELYDFRYDGVRPAGIAYCASADDVARCVAFARAHHLTPTPRAGGHSYAGYSLSNGLVVDVTRMAAVAPPVGGPGGGARGPGPATIGAGARLIDVYSGLNAAGVSVAAGSCPTVGITGLALGGGIGVVSRLHGLTADAIRAVRIVTTDSRTVTATPSEHEDLYWASRGGGGGNFGIVTAFEMATFATAPVTIFFLRWPGAAAADVLPAWQHWVPTTPDELWSTCLLAAEPAAGLGVSVGGVVVGSTATTAALVARLTAVTGTPALSLLTPEAFPQAMFVEAGCAGLALAACHLTSQGGSLPRAPSVAKSDMLTAPLADAAVRIVVDAVTARQDAGRPGAVAYDSLGGAAGRVAPTATAWSHREALFSVQYSVPLAAGGPASDVADDVAWLSAMYSRLRPYVSGQAYQNYIDPALGDWARAYYGPNLARLRQVKRSWDPDRVLDFAQAIPPA